jgi:hypothetical protein
MPSARAVYPNGHLLLLHSEHVQFLFEHHGSAGVDGIIPGADGGAMGQDISISFGSLEVSDLLPGLEGKLVLGTPRTKMIQPWIHICNWPVISNQTDVEGTLPLGLQPDLKLHARRVPDYSIEHHLSSLTFCISHPLHLHAGKELAAHGWHWYLEFAKQLDVYAKQLQRRRRKRESPNQEPPQEVVIASAPLVAVDKFVTTSIEARVWWNSRSPDDTARYKRAAMKHAEETLMGKFGNAVIGVTKISGKCIEIRRLKQIHRLQTPTDPALFGVAGQIVSNCVGLLSTHWGESTGNALRKHLPSVLASSFEGLSVSYCKVIANE